ncbi:MAG: glycosyltransferase family 2 protein [Acetobacteraceae bacterium]|nr:glycosyltransferase family 2 protein [Acetobacteraceae bacterium]
MTPPSLQVFACVRDADREILAQNLHRSPDIAAGRVACDILWNTRSAATAYNAALDTRAQADVIVFTHSDVYFPAGWFDGLARALAALPEDWAIAGLIGRDAAGAYVGRIWDVGINRMIGSALPAPAPVVAIDEFVLILRRGSGLRFDEGVPDFHCYGADLIFEAERRGLGTYVLDRPVIHNSKPIGRLPESFFDAYRYVRDKWRDRLPRHGIVVDLRPGPWMLWFRALRIRYKGTLRRSTLNFARLQDPSLKARDLGLEPPPEASAA